MEERIVIIRGLEFKCLEDGTCYVFHTGDTRGKCKNPYWKKIGGKHNRGYLAYNSTQGMLTLHRIIAVAFLGLDIENKETLIDHIDGNPSNNKVSNLRVVSHTQNCMNYQNKEIKGISQNEWGNWRAYINHYKSRYSKTFKTKEEAIEWRREKEKEFGYLHTTCL
jgi:hypothetical protein